MLGGQLSDYAFPHLQQAIADHLYNLQYYIYTVALHKYLRLRLGSLYDFTSHFGGVYYFFVRGITDSQDVSTGVFYDPLHESSEMIHLLESVFSGDMR
jgi:exodeoxyribonuclease V beta subunit